MQITVIVAICSLVVSAIACYTTYKRNDKKDTVDESAQMTTVIVKLEGISEGVKDIKKDLSEVRADVKDHGERIVRLEARLLDIERR